MKLKRRLKYILSIGIMCMFNKAVSFAVDSNIVDKSVIKEISHDNTVAFASIAKTSDKDMIFAGEIAYDINNDDGYTNAVIAKYDKDGNQLWVKNFGGSSHDYFESVIGTSDGGIVAVGSGDSTDAEFANKGSYDAIIVKCDKDGNTQWVKNFGGSDNDYFNSVIETSDKGIVAVGYSNSTDAGFNNRGNEEAIIVKYDSEGNEQWVKSFGGSYNDSFKSVIETSDKGIIVVGYGNSTDAGFTSKGEIDAVVVKYDKDGNQLWIKNYGGAGSDYFNSVIETSDKGIVIVGASNSTNAGFILEGYTDAIIIKCDSEGNQQWIKNSGKGIENKFTSVIESSNGDIVTIEVSRDLLSNEARFILFSSLIKYDKNGNELNTRNFSRGFYDSIYDIKETVDGDFIMTCIGVKNDIETMESVVSPTILYYNEDYEYIFEQINEIESGPSVENLGVIRETVNKIPEGIFKEHFQNRLNELNIREELERKTASANLDVYIKCENMLQLSLNTNSITFDDFSGVEDVVKENTVNISINSSLPYQLNAYLPTEIQNADKTKTLDKSILNIKENSEADYKEFTNINEKVILKDNCSAGNDLVHGIDLKLKGGIAHAKDVYKTTIKFEVEQK